MTGLMLALLFLPGLVIGLTVHEFAHAWSASLLGDDLARRQGRVSLNPFRHLAPLGTLALFVVHFGWGKPVPINLYNFKHPKRDYLISSLAGPFANVVIIGVCWLLMQMTRHTYSVGASGGVFLELGHAFLMLTAMINAILAAINLLPVPPLDGSKIWPILIPGLKPSFGRRTTWIFMILIIAFIWSGKLSRVLDPVFDAVDAIMPASDRMIFNEHAAKGDRAMAEDDYEQAQSHYTRALDMNPAAPEVLYARAVAREWLGETEAALVDMNRAIEVRPRIPEYYDLRADLLWLADRDEDAAADREMAKALRLLHPEPGSAAPARYEADSEEKDSQTQPAPTEPRVETFGDHRGDPERALKLRLPRVEFIRTPLKDVLNFFGAYCGVQLQVDWTPLAALGVSAETVVSFEADDCPVDTALAESLNSAAGGKGKLGYAIKDGKIIIPAPAGPATTLPAE